MNEKQILNALRACNEVLSEFRIERWDAASLPPLDKGNQLRHASWMVSEAIKFTREGKLEKANRWLGFVQGVLWSTGQQTIEDMRQMNMGRTTRVAPEKEKTC